MNPLNALKPQGKPSEDTVSSGISGIKELLKKKNDELKGREADIQSKKDDRKKDEGTAKLQIRFSPDNLICQILVPLPTPTSPEPTEAEIFDFLKSYGVVHGLNKSSVNMIFTFKAYGTFREVAVGTPAVDGQDASATFFFDTNPNLAPRELANGMVDYKELGLLQNVRKGEVLAKITRETDPIPGKDVFGNPIPGRAGQPLPPLVGRNVVANKDGSVLSAEESGHVSYAEGRVSIMDTYEHFGDVGIKSGNIEFVGNLVVKGDVRDGFSVKCERNLIVHGNVESAKIDVVGDCTISGGANGKKVGSITCGGNFVSRFIENMTVVSGKNVTTSSIMNSMVEAGGDINCVNRPGVIVGGVLSAGGNIFALSVGTPNTTNLTEINIGVPPAQLRLRKELKEQIETMRDELVEINKAVAYFSDLQHQGRMPDNRKEQASSLLLSQGKKKFRILKLDKELQAIETEILSSRFGQLAVYYTMNRPVQITINSMSRTISEPISQCRFFNSNGNVVHDNSLPPQPRT